MTNELKFLSAHMYFDSSTLQKGPLFSVCFCREGHCVTASVKTDVRSRARAHTHGRTLAHITNGQISITKTLTEKSNVINYNYVTRLLLHSYYTHLNNN